LRLSAVAGESAAFKAVVVKWKLDVNRYDEGVIFSRFHGNDIKRLCQAVGDLTGKHHSTGLIKYTISAVSNEPNYKKITNALSVFDVWCRLVSITDTSLSDDRIQAISCREAHLNDRNCCETARLGCSLEEVGGFGGSALVHVMIMHLGPFVWEHKMIGALAEKGIEAVHSKLDTEIERHKRTASKRFKMACDRCFNE
jgi:hypothetical protein